MTQVVGVRFRDTGKVYFFDPNKLNINAGDQVIVETARGIEYGNILAAERDARAVIASVFQSFKSVYYDVFSVLKSGISNNTAHKPSTFNICVRRAKLRVK